MNLSLKKKFGMIHVRGGAIVRVAKEHAVHSRGRSTAEDDKVNIDGTPMPVGTPQGDRDWVFARVGDLAVEIIAVKTGKCLGHSYLSGPALQCNRYTPAQDDWFVPGSGEMLVIPDPHTWPGTHEELYEIMATIVVAAKYGDKDVAGFEIVAHGEEDAKNAANTIGDMTQLCPVDETARKLLEERPQRCHLVGIIHYDKKRKYGITFHSQPPDDAVEHCASQFQIGLVLSALKGPK